MINISPQLVDYLRMGKRRVAILTSKEFEGSLWAHEKREQCQGPDSANALVACHCLEKIIGRHPQAYIHLELTHIS